MHRRLVRLFLLFALLQPVCSETAGLGGSRPSVVFILTDDQGYGDLSAHGNTVLKTPHLDALHASAMRFTDFHVSPTCAPTRAALMTGRHEFKNGVTHTILERERLTLAATTIAQVLKSAGYRTGIFGKWHLGDEPEYQPGRRGFDEVFIHGGGGIGQTYPGSCGDAPGNTYFDPAILHNGVFVRTRGFCTDSYFSQATQWISRQTSPFFAFITPNTPHAPLTAKAQDAALYRDKVKSEDLAKFFGMLHNIDQNVGQMLAFLRNSGRLDSTLIIFMNDNGGTVGTQIFNSGMRGAKGTAYSGGTRAISLWSWQGRINPADCSALTAHIDVFPTLAEIAGAELPATVRAQIEGRSLVPLLKDPSALWPERTLFTHLGRWNKGTDPSNFKYRMCSVRRSEWHLVSADGGKNARWQLFNLNNDPGEQHDLSAREAAVVERLSESYEAWWSSIQSSLVNENVAGPATNPYKELFYKQFGGSPTTGKGTNPAASSRRGF